MSGVKISYNGETLNISPIKLSVGFGVLERLEIGEIQATFGIETLAVEPAKFDERLCTLSIHTNGDHSAALRCFNCFVVELFPFVEGGGEVVGVSKNCN